MAKEGILVMCEYKCLVVLAVLAVLYFTHKGLVRIVGDEDIVWEVYGLQGGVGFSLGMAYFLYWVIYIC